MANNNLTKSIQAGSDGLSSCIIFFIVMNFIMNILLSGSMIYMSLFLRSIQIILHLPLLRILVPSNVGMVNEIIFPIAMFDVIDAEYSTKLVFDFDYQGHNVNV